MPSESVSALYARITAATLLVLLSATAATARAAAPVELLVKGNDISAPAWILKSDNTKQWTDIGCRSKLAAAGIPVTYTDWSRIGGHRTGSWDSCERMLLTVDDRVITPGSSNANVTLLLNGPVTSSSQSGWVRYADNTRQWIDPECRQTLQSRGIAEVVTDWDGIAPYPTGAWRSCTQIANLMNSNSPQPASGNNSTGVTLKLTQPNDSGWAILTNNSRIWIDSDCRARMQAVGVTTTFADWDNIAQHPAGGWRSCNDIVSMIDTNIAAPSSGTGPSTGSGVATTPDFNKNCIGINDDFPFSWDGGSLMTDAFKSARGPLLNNFSTPSSMDADKWPIGNQTVNFVLGEGDHNLDELNPWVLLPYEQSGSWQWGPQLGSWTLDDASYQGRVTYSGVTGHEFWVGQNTISLQIAGGNIPSGSRNRWHFVPKAVAAQYAQAMRDENFRYIFDTDKYGLDVNFPLLHTQAKTQMADFCRIRFLLGSNVNSLEFSGYDANRTKPSHPTFSTPGGDGLPYEWEVWIANHLNINVFHTDHVKTWEAWKAGDRYLTDQANYFAQNLRGSVIREYGNEIWNQGYPYENQTLHVWDNGPYPDPGRTNWEWMNRNYGKRSYDTAGPWADAFASRRQDLDLTIAVQSANPPLALERLTAANGQSYGNRIDSVSGAFYFGLAIIPDGDVYQSIRNSGYSAVVANHRTDLNKLKADLTQLINITRPYVDKVHLYEGGSHMNFPEFNSGNSRHVGVFNEVTRFLNSNDYTTMLDEFGSFWRAQWGSGEMMWFHLNGQDTPAEPWGYYRSHTDATAVHSGTQSFIRSYSSE